MELYSFTAVESLAKSERANWIAHKGSDEGQVSSLVSSPHFNPFELSAGRSSVLFNLLQCFREWGYTRTNLKEKLNDLHWNVQTRKCMHTHKHTHAHTIADSLTTYFHRDLIPAAVLLIACVYKAQLCMVRRGILGCKDTISCLCYSQESFTKTLTALCATNRWLIENGIYVFTFFLDIVHYISNAAYYTSGSHFNANCLWWISSHTHINSGPKTHNYFYCRDGCNPVDEIF